MSRAVYHNKERISKRASTSAFDDKIFFFFLKEMADTEWIQLNFNFNKEV